MKLALRISFIAFFVLVVLAGIFMSKSLYARDSGYGYTSDVESRATVLSAQRILERNGGIFIGTKEIRTLFNTNARLPYTIPFTERDLFDCGRCVLFPTVSKIGYRGKSATINNLWRAPEAKRLFRRGDSLLNPWWKKESFANEQLKTKWHLVRLEVEDKGISPRSQRFYVGHEKPPKANVAFWMMLLLPADTLKGDWFFTANQTHKGRDIVTIGRPISGAIDISYTPNIIGNTRVGRLAEIIPSRRSYRK